MDRARLLLAAISATKYTVASGVKLTELHNVCDLSAVLPRTSLPIRFHGLVLDAAVGMIPLGLDQSAREGIHRLTVMHRLADLAARAGGFGVLDQRRRGLEDLEAIRTARVSACVGGGEEVSFEGEDVRERFP